MKSQIAHIPIVSLVKKQPERLKERQHCIASVLMKPVNLKRVPANVSLRRIVSALTVPAVPVRADLRRVQRGLRLQILEGPMLEIRLISVTGQNLRP